MAAASLQDIGLLNGADVVGGIEAWKEEGLPIELEIRVVRRETAIGSIVRGAHATRIASIKIVWHHPLIRVVVSVPTLSRRSGLTWRVPFLGWRVMIVLRP